MERGGKVRTSVVPNRKKNAIQAKSESTWKLVPRSIPMRCFHITD